MKYYFLTVTEDSWREHLLTGIAAINNPGHNPSNRQGNAQKQGALCEFIGIEIGDRLFFYVQGQKVIKGLYKAVSEPFFDVSNLVPSNSVIDRKFPIRIEFQQERHYEIDVTMDELWQLKDNGLFWSLQQQRGDAVGRHACLGLLKTDGECLLNMFSEKNPRSSALTPINVINHITTPLQFDIRSINGRIHYEKALQGLLLVNLKNDLHKNILGEYDYFVPFFPTSAQTEIDIMLTKHSGSGEVLWYTLIEIKSNQFTLKEIKTLVNYENWAIRALAGNNARKVHSICIAFDFNQDIINFVQNRSEFVNKSILLVKYFFDHQNNSISLTAIN